MKKYRSLFLSENFQFLEMKFSMYLNRRVFVMICKKQIPMIDTSDAQTDCISSDHIQHKAVDCDPLTLCMLVEFQQMTFCNIFLFFPAFEF